MTENNPNDKPEPSTSQMWGGRFAQGPSAVMEAINASIGFDKRLFAQDIFGSIAHCRMLVNQNILSPEDGDAIVSGLKTIAEEIVAGQFPFKTELEDIHMNVEARLAELIGDAAGRLHTARSRNDQVATDFRLWVREAIDRIDQHARDLQGVMIALAESHADTVMPGFTHLQSAQPVTFGHHMLAYVEMLGRDRGRLRDCRIRLNECPLGAAALAGTSFPIDRHRVAAELGFDRPAANSLDAVSDRDFAMEFLAALSITAVHLSRLSEEIIIWCSAPFGFVSLSDAWSTGSSIMPQKRNPDAAELIRARAGRVIGDLNALMIVMKGLPLAYSKDMQDDKEPVFEAADGIELALIAMRHMLAEMTVNSAPMEKLAGAGYSTATDLADWLVRELGMPFRRAHHVTGELVKKAEAKACDLEKLTIEEMRSVEPAITDAVYSVLGVANSVASRTSFGGTAPANVREAARLARARFLAGAEATGPA